MAKRPIYLSCFDSSAYVICQEVTFKWVPGMAAAQVRRCIESLHEQAKAQLNRPDLKVLEISTKSATDLGRELSAFNLRFKSGALAGISVEAAYQSGKIVAATGINLGDLLTAQAIDAKRDARVQARPQLSGFRLHSEDEVWPLEPESAFYCWVYCRALRENPELADSLVAGDYEAFTDIKFNPKRSLNSQACAGALYVSLNRRHLLDEAMAGKNAFLRVLGPRPIAASGWLPAMSDRQLEFATLKGSRNT